MRGGGVEPEERLGTGSTREIENLDDIKYVCSCVDQGMNICHNPLNQDETHLELSSM